MHPGLREHQMAGLLDQAFGTLPVPVLSPAHAYQLLVRGQVERVAVQDMAAGWPRSWWFPTYQVMCITDYD